MLNEHSTTGRAAVLGAGTMGAQIAAHLANIGWQVLLLDLTLDHAKQGLERVSKLKPAPFYLPELASRIELGSFETDFPRLKEADWVIEAVVEKPDIKRELWTRVQDYVAPNAVLSTNTSGLSIHEMSDACREDIKRRFLGTHFFNPPRYLKLLELIPRRETDPDILEGVARFAERVLGKRVVIARDTPGFIANRLGVHSMMVVFPLMQEFGMTIEEVDALTGPLIGNPRSATFRLADIVGLDVMASVAGNLHERLATDAEKRVFALPEVVQRLIADGRLGEKTGAGFYRRQKDGTIEALDLNAYEYRPRQKAKFPHLDALEKLPLEERLRALVNHDSREGRFLWRLHAETLAYAAQHAPDLADDPIAIDHAVKWGFNRELGPFQTWDALGVRETVERMEREGLPVPELAHNLLRFGRTRFYETADTGDTTVYVWLGAGQVAPYRPDPEFLTPTNMARHCPEVERNADASIYDLGDGVFCVGIHSKMNVLGPGVMEMLYKGAERAEREGIGLVITGIGEHFSAGFNLQLFLMMIGTGDFDELLMGGKAFQDSLLRLRYAKVPVVAATFGYTLGGGCELAMHCDRVVASAETYIGLPEVGVGIIPAGGGTSTMLYRALSSLPPNADPYPAIRRVMETLGFGKVATSALEGVQYGFLRHGVDTISVNPDRILWLAKQEVQHLAAQGYTPPEEPKVMAYGNQVLTRLLIELHNLKRGNFITEHDFTVASQIAYVLAGGDLSQPAEMPLSYFYQLEIQVVGYLAQQPKTWERMRHMLETGKPLRN
ncbi:3-hydroxyacyl-CoA dehydrogenase/enoyl-CoA hydratase family protein [Synechococcus sp. RC10B2]|uniref:3-hydroxyacyl-CoA dehydrogenase/enoyl-CoA hydratase family protein n=1 Tax=Synechococcus sp. RC10B2 TaxID=2964530 RepID=UPI0039C5CF4D